MTDVYQKMQKKSLYRMVIVPLPPASSSGIRKKYIAGKRSTQLFFRFFYIKKELLN
jgi:hypothetical protein